MGCERIIAFVLALVLCIAAIEAGTLTKKRSVTSEFFENELVKVSDFFLNVQDLSSVYYSFNIIYSI